MRAAQRKQGPVELLPAVTAHSSARGLERSNVSVAFGIGDFLQKHWIVELLKA